MEREAARQLARVQVAMWIGDNWCRCVICAHAYESVDDFLERDPVFIGKDDRGLMVLADSACWETAHERVGRRRTEAG